MKLLQFPNKKLINYGLGFIDLADYFKVLDISYNKDLFNTLKKKNKNAEQVSLFFKNEKNIYFYTDKFNSKDNSYDVITLYESTYYIDDIISCFKEVFRMLKSGGKFAVILKTENKAENKNKLNRNIYTRYQIKDLLATCGFKDIEIHYNELHYSCIVGGK